MKLPRPVLFFVAALALAAPSPAPAEDGWEHETTDQGIEVTVHKVPGRDLPVFRGVGTIDAGMLELLAVMDDMTHYTEWVPNCASARLLRRINEFERISYNRIAAPWPVSDRDITIHSWVEASLAKHEVWARFEAVTAPEQGPVEGVVRMPRLVGYYHLEAIDLTHTKVTYQVDADPGGALPAWLVKLTSRKIPIGTISGLRTQVARMRGQYEGFLKRYDPDRGGKIPDQFAK